MKSVSNHVRKNWKRYLVAAVAAGGAAYGVNPELSSSVATKIIEVLVPVVGQ